MDAGFIITHDKGFAASGRIRGHPNRPTRGFHKRGWDQSAVGLVVQRKHTAGPLALPSGRALQVLDMRI